MKVPLLFLAMYFMNCLNPPTLLSADFGQNVRFFLEQVLHLIAMILVSIDIIIIINILFSYLNWVSH